MNYAPRSVFQFFVVPKVAVVITPPLPLAMMDAIFDIWKAFFKVWGVKP